MVRTQIYLSAADIAALDRAAKETGRTRSVLVREAIAAKYGPSAPALSLAEVLRATAGAWRRSPGNDPDGAAWVERMRKGSLAKKLRRLRQR